MKTRWRGLQVAITSALLLGAGTALLISTPGLHTEGSSWDGSGHIGSPYLDYDGSEGQTFLVPPQQQLEPEPDVSGSVRGMLVDETDSPVRGVEVELIPVGKTGNERWYATLRDWTNQQGEYRFSSVNPGEYFLAVQKRSAPDGRHPFVGTYYPGVDHELSADRILVVASSPTDLHTLRLQRIDTVTLKVTVIFEDGSRPAWSNLLFHNLSFPDQAVIGDEAPGVENGLGEFTIPKGFEYYAQAKVDCDAGPRIETRESRPVQRIRIEDGLTPDEITFLIPGSACRLWSPK